MSKFYLKSFVLKDYIILILPFLISPIFMSKSQNIIQSIVFSNYVCIGINNAFIIFSFIKINEMNSSMHLIIPRIGNTYFYKKTILSSCIMTFLFFVFQYIFMTICYGGVPVGYEKYVLLFSLYYSILFIVMQSILCMQIGKRMNLTYLLIPLFLNLVFHYYFVQNYFSL